MQPARHAVAAEQQDGRRILFEDEHSIAFVPYFARYAYEVYVAPKRTVPHVHALADAEVESLAQALKAITVRYDNLWQMSFPYVMPLHQAPTDGGDYAAFHFYIAFHPPLRRPNLIKFLAGKDAGSVDRFILLDAQDWMTDDLLNDLWTEITRTASVGARVIFRTAAEPSLLPGRVSSSLLDQWTYENDASREFSARDRSAIYGGFHLYVKRAA